MMELLKVSALFALTAVMEIVGCYLPWLVLRQGKPVWLLLPAAVALAVFAWLLTCTLPPQGAPTRPTGACTSSWRWLGCTSSTAWR